MNTTHTLMFIKTMIDMTIDIKPLPQPRPRFARRGNFVTTYDTPKIKTYKKHIEIAVKNEMVSKNISMTERPLIINLTFTFAPPKSYPKYKVKEIMGGKVQFTKNVDVDNLAKAVMDAINGVAYKDDRQVVELNVKKRYGEKDAVHIKIKEV